jgi:hypothetical protein
VTDFGPQLLAKILKANQTQEDSLALVFHYADEKGLRLLDLSDLRALLTFLESDAGKPELEGIGGLASSTVGVLLRSLVGLEDGGGTEFFGEAQLEIADLLRTAPDGRGVISMLELPSVQDKPRLFSTALMWLLAELFEQLPEPGDLDIPKTPRSTLRCTALPSREVRKSPSTSVPPEGTGAGAAFLRRRARGLSVDGSASAATVASSILAASFSRALSASTRVPYLAWSGEALAAPSTSSAGPMREAGARSLV